jgi:23S rRNA pseudouridine1911/1915/1917 synthase
MEPTILFEDKDVLVVNKPAGLIVHSDGRRTLVADGKTKEKTLVDFLLEKYPKIKDVGEPGRAANGEEVMRSGIVHRLDRETSGVMLVAKTQKSFENLKKQFQERQVKKIYQAFLYGEMKTKSGTIDRPIGRSSQDFRMWSAQRGARGELREAVTNYKVLCVRDGYSFVEVSPQTGRTHQIRVHFKAINYPLVADPLYAPKRENTLGFTRLALHSLNVTFADLKGKSRMVIAPYPEDFERAMGVLQIT